MKNGNGHRRNRRKTHGYQPVNQQPVYDPPAMMFAPHSFQKQVRYMNDIPIVYITREAFSRMWHYVDIATKEVGWLGTVTQTELGNFIIHEVFLLKQEVTGTSTEISEDGIAELTQELLDIRPDGMEVANAIRFWGHSHVRMHTAPSGQDEDQMELFRDNGCPWFIRGILNKLGRMEFSIFFFDANIRIDDAPWAVYEFIDESTRAEIETEFVDKVTEVVCRPPQYQMGFAHPAAVGGPVTHPGFNPNYQDEEAHLNQHFQDSEEHEEALAHDR